MKRVALISIFVPLLMSATTVETDSLRNGHRVLKEVEVIGVKQMPDAVSTAVTHITPAMLSSYNITDMKDVSLMAPNFYLPDYGSRITSSIYVRGLGARIDQPIVGLSVDNVPVMNKDAYDFDVADIESIEILRGAQSLLNGRNTMGGQVNIRTISPWNFKGLRFSASYGRNNYVKSSLSWYHRINDKLATSLSGLIGMTDGYFVNEANGQKIDSDCSGSARWKLCWRPSTWLSVTNAASASITRQGGYPYESLATGQIAYGDTCFYHRTTFADGLTVAWAGKRVVVTSVTTAQYIDDNMTLDQDFLTDDYFTLMQKRHEWSFTEDLFAKGTRGNYSWLGGVFAFSKSGTMLAPVTFLDTGISRLIEDHRNEMNPYYPIEWDSREFVLGSDFGQTSRGLAFYHESDYRLGSWVFQAGVRWDTEWTGLKHHSKCMSGYTTYRLLDDGSYEPFDHTPLNIDDRGEMHRTYMEVLPKLAVTYDTHDFRAYASITKGYKAGGFNTQMFSDVLQQRLMQYMGLSMNYSLDEIVSYKPEKSWNYEIGAHYVFPGARLTADATLFYINCIDQQLTMFPPGMTTGRIMTNAARTDSRGAELSLVWRPVDALTLRASYGYTHATFRKFLDAKGDYSGKRVPYAPANTLFASANWQLPFTLLNGRPSVDVNVRGVGDIYWDEANSVRQPFYALLGASASLAWDRWSVRLWGENLTSARYSTFYFLSIGNAFVQRGRPWNAGVAVRMRFTTD